MLRQPGTPPVLHCTALSLAALNDAGSCCSVTSDMTNTVAGTTELAASRQPQGKKTT